MTPVLSFLVSVPPVGQPRCQFGNRRAYTPPTSLAFKGAIRHAALKAAKGLWLDEPVAVHADCFFPRPQSHFKADGTLKDWAPKWCATRPDRDNVEKAILDALGDRKIGKLTDRGIWRDDCLVVDGPVRKFYSTPNGFVGCVINIFRANV